MNYLASPAERERVSERGVRQGDGLRFLQCVVNRLEHAFEVEKQVVRPETDDAPAMSLQPSGPLLITQLLLVRAVLLAIGLDDQSGRNACEVRKEGTDRKLPAELASLEASSPQVEPEPPLSLAHELALLSRSPHL
jgi:hypothetical protein